MSEICFSSNECSFLIYIEMFSTVNSSMASKMAAEFEILFIGDLFCSF